MTRFAPFAAVLCLAAAGVARAGDETGPAKEGKDAPKAARTKGTDIRWAPTWSEAAEECAERNVPMMIHSHASTCPPCKALHKLIFENDAYVAWANAETVHVLSYSLDAEPDEPEPLVDAERGGEKVRVLASFPMFRPEEVDVLLAELNVHVKYPKSTPWTGVVDATGKVLAEMKKGTPKECRELYEAEQKKLGAFLPRKDWIAVRAVLQESVDAEFSEDWAKAVGAALAARALRAEFPAAIEERVKARLFGLAGEAKRQTEAADKTADPAKREAALAKVKRAFAPLSEPTAAAKK
jgi:hypothetical protein